MAGSRATLTVREGPQRGQTFELASPSTVGRSKSCTVSVEDADVSRVHLVIEFEANEHTLRDNGSANGTFLNGRKINVAALRHGDLITLGGTTLIFQIGVAARPSSGPIAASMSLSLGAVPFDAVNRDSGVASLASALQKYKVLFRASELIARLPQDEGFFGLVLENLLEIMAADRGLVLLGTTETALEMVAKLSRQAAVDLQPVSTTLLKRVLSNGEAILVKDTLLDDRLQDSDSMLATGSRSLICAPLRANDTTFGVIQLESHVRQSAFDESDLQLVAALARQAGVALSHGRIEKSRVEAVDRAKLRRSVSAPMAERLLKQPPEWKRGARHQLCLLFVDLRPLTSGDTAGLEAVNAAVGKMTEIVFDHSGVLSRLTPDALFAFWGAPFRESDDARKAIETALDMQSLWRQETGVPGIEALRCALHSGNAFVGEYGASTRSDYAVLGTAVEDTARFTAHLPPGMVGVSDLLYRELSTQLDGEWTPAFTVRPGSEPTRLFVVSAVRI